MSSGPSLESFWSAVEGGDAPAPLASPEPLVTALLEAGRAELSFRVDDARAALAASVAATGPWARVRALLLARLSLRASDALGLAATASSLSSLVQTLPDDEAATRCRALHTAGIVALRRGELDAAEESLVASLALAEGEPLRTWLLDGFGQVFLAAGAWQEARRTLQAVAARKLARGDALGRAITLGHLALLELRLGHPDVARALALGALDDAAMLAPLSRLRLATLALQAELDAELEPVSLPLVQRPLAEAGDAIHPLKGFAATALARASADAGVRSRWLDVARLHLAGGEDEAWLRYWEARLTEGAPLDAAWLDHQQALFARSPVVGEAEVATWLLLAERSRDAACVRRYLDAAYDAAARSNAAAWLDRVDRACRTLDPAGLDARLVHRFAGRSAQELDRTVQEDATIVFADLVGFTPRSLELPADEVMATVRSLFELAVPLLVRHRVRPLSCLGDGLLAVAQGDAHEERGARFALDLVRRATRVSAVRGALGDAWSLDMRGGVASGRVVLGAIGTLFKREFAAIGPTTNLAARLQASAAPGEVVVSGTCPIVTHAAFDPLADALVLKGYADRVDATRYRPVATRTGTR